MALIIYICFVLGYVYEDSDSLLVVNDSIVMCGFHPYNLKVHLSNDARLKIRIWNGVDSTGKIIFQAPFIYIHSSSIDGTGRGYTGGTNAHPNGYGTGYGYAGGLSGGGGGGGGGRLKIFYSILDTTHLTLFCSGGNGGIGGYGNGENGSTGSVFFGPLVAMEEISKNNFSDFRILPRITSGILMVYSDINNGDLLLYDATGRLLKKTRIYNKSHRLDLSDLQSGVYFVKFDAGKYLTKIVLIK